MKSTGIRRVTVLVLLVLLLAGTIGVQRTALAAPTDGWYTENGYTYYYENGTKVTSQVKLISGSYYLFQSDGRMLDNALGSLKIDGTTYYFMANSGGKLYQNQWYDHPNGNRYYFGSDCRSFFGLNTIGGSQYYFDQNGQLARRKELTVNGTRYLASETGSLVAMKANGFTTSGSITMYSEGGVTLKNQVIVVDGKRYLLQVDGIRLENNYASIYDSAEGRYVYYRAKENGVLYENEWYTGEDGKLWYYGAEGKANAGFFTLNGIRYCSNGIETFVWDYVTYYAGPDGATGEYNANGFTVCGNNTFYFQNGVMQYGYVRVDGKLYYLKEDGSLLKGGKIDCTHPETGNTITIYAKSDGSLSENEWLVHSVYGYRY